MTSVDFFKGFNNIENCTLNKIFFGTRKIMDFLNTLKTSTKI